MSSTRRLVLVALGLLALPVLGLLALGLPPSPEWDTDASGTTFSTAPALPPSELNLPVRYELDPVLEAVERSVPTIFGDLSRQVEHPSLPTLRYAFEAQREPFHMELVGDTLRVTTELAYRAQGWFDTPFGATLTGGCPRGDAPPPRAVITVSAPIHIAGDWSLNSRATVESVQPRTSSARDRCVVAPLQVDLTEWLMLTAQDELEGWTRELDRTLASVDLPLEMARYWQLLREPIPVGPESWLVLDPRGIRQGSMEQAEGSGRTLEAEVALRTYPRIELGSRPEIPHLPLPALEHGPVDDGFELTVDGHADYETLTELIAIQLDGQAFELGPGQVRIEGTRLTPLADGRLGLELELDGSIRGRLLLSGRPSLDPDRGEITFPDLDFRLQTRNVLARAGARIVRIAFPHRVREWARWPVDDLFEDGRILASQGLNRRLSADARLEGDLSSLEVGDILATRDGLVVRSVLGGSLRLVIHPRPAQELGS
jgi:hypothetical protein